MNPSHFLSGTDEPTVVITRVSQWRWHALDDDQVVGRGEASPRPDGRLFLSIDAWHRTVFDRLAGAVLADLPKPLYTVVDEVDQDVRSGWDRAGFTTRRREWEYHLPTDPAVAVLPPDGVRIATFGTARENPLRDLYNAIRDEVEAAVGWQEMPVEVLVRPDGTPPLDLSKYAVAIDSGEYAGLVRVVARRRHARIGLVAVRAGRQRRGIARALLTHVLGVLQESGIETASADVNEANAAAIALFEGLGARPMGSNLELVLR